MGGGTKPKICYTPNRFGGAARLNIDRANAIIEEYAAQGYRLTLRQLYYRFVARDFIPNTKQSYKRLGHLINVARLAGKIDWDYITDRTRNLHALSHWNNPSEIIDACAKQFRIDKDADQSTRIEIWYEKEALSEVFERVADELDVPSFANRGYNSQSEMWAAAQRLIGHVANGQEVVVLHFGDHDPSGVDMTRDIEDRLRLFLEHMEGDLTIDRLALNMDQIRHHRPPPNPAKVSDSRAKAYIRAYGRSSWELDALDPATLADIVRRAVTAARDQRKWKVKATAEKKHRGLLKKVAEQWPTITKNLGKRKPPQKRGRGK